MGEAEEKGRRAEWGRQGRREGEKDGGDRGEGRERGMAETEETGGREGRERQEKRGGREGWGRQRRREGERDGVDRGRGEGGKYQGLDKRLHTLSSSQLQYSISVDKSKPALHLNA